MPIPGSPGDSQAVSVSSLQLFPYLNHSSLDAEVKDRLMVASGQETKDGGGKQGRWQRQPGRQG